MLLGQGLLKVEPGASFVGTVSSEGTSHLELTPGSGSLAPSDIVGFKSATIDPSATWSLSGTLASATSVEDDGVFGVAASGNLTIGGGVTAASGGTGQITIGNAATLSLNGSVAATETIGFATSSRLALATAGAVGATLSGFDAGDTLALPGATSASLSTSYSGSGNGGTLTLNQNGTLYATFALLGQYAASGFQVVADPNAGADIVYMPCFLRGTHIATPDGERRVETLRIGETVLTAAHEALPVAWIGRRTVDCRRHPLPRSVAPVRVQAHAFGPNHPHRDLLLSPDHAIAYGGVLIPVGLLIDARETVDIAEYLHIELARHDLLLAENLAVESYLDDGNRWQFGGPRKAALTEASRCVPLVLAGPTVSRARRLLASHRAAQPGFTVWTPRRLLASRRDRPPVHTMDEPPSIAPSARPAQTDYGSLS